MRSIPLLSQQDFLDYPYLILARSDQLVVLPAPFTLSFRVLHARTNPYLLYSCVAYNASGSNDTSMREASI
jgi:hypothetical protein